MNAGPWTTLPRDGPLIPIRDGARLERGPRSEATLQRSSLLGKVPARDIGVEVPSPTRQPGAGAVDDEVSVTHQTNQRALR